VERLTDSRDATQERLREAVNERETANSQLAKYAGSHSRLESLQKQLKSLEPYLTQEQQLPVYEERLKGAKARKQTAQEQASQTDEDIAGKIAERDKTEREIVRLKASTADVASIDEIVGQLEAEVNDLYQTAGILNQKISAIDECRSKIRVLCVKKDECASEETDYEILKAAFSQDGIPHQIIRSVVPRITATANDILAQMTGGKMGVDFVMEKSLKSSKDKERPTLDILIEEYGKAPLPYLSKSGGEKVKASLSVILALAETKATSAGIQMGMLFVDEPPFLDSEGVQAYVDALEAIQKRYPDIKVMAITHDQEFKARFPQSLTVYKDEHGSHVVWD
jgi:exonuclease SbcC